MKFKSPILVGAILLLHSSLLLAQVEKVVYQYLHFNDSTQNLHLQLTDEYEIIPWHHESQILVESHATLDGGSMDLLAVLIKEGRYQVKFEQSNGNSSLKPVSTNRVLIKNKGQLCQETVKMKIFIPDVYVKVGDSHYSKNSETILASKK